MSEERSAQKSQLPFRLESGQLRGGRYVVIHYEGRTRCGDGTDRPCHYSLQVSDPDGEEAAQCGVNAILGRRILELVAMYHAAENAALALEKRAVEAEEESKRLQGELASLKRRVAGMESQRKSAKE